MPIKDLHIILASLGADMFKSYKEEAYSYIRNGILAGDIPPGARLSDIALSRQMKISRTPIREALNQLVSENLATQIPHYGMFVRTMERQELEELYDLRELLEGYAAFQAAKKRMPEHVKEMRELLSLFQEVIREIRSSCTTETVSKVLLKQASIEIKFHDLILKAAFSPMAHRIVEDMRILMNIFMYKKMMPDEDRVIALERVYKGHEAIYKSIESQDADSAALNMRQHLRQAKGYGLASFDYQKELMSTEKHNKSKD